MANKQEDCKECSVLLDCRLNMTHHVFPTARTCLFHLRRIRQDRPKKRVKRITIQLVTSPPALSRAPEWQQRRPCLVLATTYVCRIGIYMMVNLLYTD